MNISPTAWIEAIEKYLGQTKGWLAMHERVRQLEARVAELEAGKSSVSGVVCDNCGNAGVERIGTRPDPGPFGAVGARQGIFHCRKCGHDSFIPLPDV